MPKDVNPFTEMILEIESECKQERTIKEYALEGKIAL